MRILKILTALMCVLLAATACNTMRGMGKDIEKGGEAIQKAASK